MGQHGTAWDSMGQHGTAWDSMGSGNTGIERVKLGTTLRDCGHLIHDEPWLEDFLKSRLFETDNGRGDMASMGDS